ncbi:hypothetical protein AAFP30_07235 [Gordonia sp. CPCC 205515]|uniref:hypothetical protein n=1 Tax=Gordonia sp. CPCC 205515 TaxID=3140791 RepID=UPI003AF354C5
MDKWGAVVGLGLIAVTVGVIAYVRYRERETRKLQGDVTLARDLRALAGDDAVRLAAVDEFELAIYQRLFYASVVAPRLRSAAWALLGTVLAVVAVLFSASGGGLTFDVVHIAALVLAVVFGVAAVVFVALAAYHSATTPRVSFKDSYATD